MGLYTGSLANYYGGLEEYGAYQFISITDIINNFRVAYVGEDKIIPKISRADIKFHAMRGLQELSFDTLKSCKSLELEVPPSLLLPIPHDYVNYIKLTWTDSNGNCHPINSCRDCFKDPLSYQQREDGSINVGRSTKGSTSPELVRAAYGVGCKRITVKSGCTDKRAINYDETATVHVGHDCCYTPEECKKTSNRAARSPNVVANATNDGVCDPSNPYDWDVWYDAVYETIEIPGSYSDDPVEIESSTWKNKSNYVSNKNNTANHNLSRGARYGLDGKDANTNGSYWINCRSGKIHFSSNLAGKTVILEYISDHLGTDDEMKVHKFAEEAMYKHIAHSILNTRAGMDRNIVATFKKERFAAIRSAKLRLSSIKLSEITQILRGKSKWIKH